MSFAQRLRDRLSVRNFFIGAAVLAAAFGITQVDITNVQARVKLRGVLDMYGFESLELTGFPTVRAANDAFPDGGAPAGWYKAGGRQVEDLVFGPPLVTPGICNLTRVPDPNADCAAATTGAQALRNCRGASSRTKVRGLFRGLRIAGTANLHNGCVVVAEIEKIQLQVLKYLVTTNDVAVPAGFKNALTDLRQSWIRNPSVLEQQAVGVRMGHSFEKAEEIPEDGGL